MVETLSIQTLTAALAYLFSIICLAQAVVGEVRHRTKEPRSVERRLNWLTFVVGWGTFTLAGVVANS